MQQAVQDLQSRLGELLARFEEQREEAAALRERLRIAERTIRIMKAEAERSKQATSDRALGGNMDEEARDALRQHIDQIVAEIDQILAPQQPAR